MNILGNSVHYGEQALILRLKTMNPSFFHRHLLKGLIITQKLALLSEDLTQEEKDSLLVMNEMLMLLMPTDALLEQLVSELTPI